MTAQDGFAYAMGTYRDLHSYQSHWYEFGDSETQWRANMQNYHTRRQLESLGWADAAAIEYDINEFGFRSTDFGTPSDLAVFGDSYTFGVGLPNHCLWHNLLAQSRSWRCANFGVAGASARTCYRLARYWLPRLQPKHAIFVMPHCTRLEVATQASDGCMTTPYLVSSTIADDFLKRWWSTDFNSQQERDIVQQALINICHNHGIPVLFFTVEFFEQNFLTYSDRARDLCHGGRAFQQRVADHIKEKVNHGQWH